jgi:predicted TIM-barrel fold metal-dependent hydrolase
MSIAPLSRRAFTAGLAALSVGCGRLVTTAYLKAARCSPGVCWMVDVHCHIFNASDLNVAGFISHIAPVPRKWTTKLTTLLHGALDRRAASAREELTKLDAIIASKQRVSAPELPPANEKLAALAKMVGATIPLDASRTAGRLLDTLRLIVRSRSEIAATMVTLYDQIDLFTPAMVDYGYWSEDDTESPLSDQLLVQAQLSRASMLGLIGRMDARIHSFAPFNPLREVREVMAPATEYMPLGAWRPGSPYACDAPALSAMPDKGSLALLRYAIENLGFIGAKIYPPTGFMPIDNEKWPHHATVTGLGKGLDQALRALYAYCEAQDVPLMTHGSNSNGYNLGYGILTGPELWEKVLAEYPTLRLNVGHFGHLEGDDGERGIEACELWMRKIADLMERYPNVYADCGCSSLPVEQAYQDRYLKLLAQLYQEYPKAKLRFMYGSDYWLNKLSANSGTFVNAFSAVYKLHFPEVHQNFFGNNALRFLGLLDDAGAKAESATRRRLRVLYRGLEAPAWL